METYKPLPKEKSAQKRMLLKLNINPLKVRINPDIAVAMKASMPTHWKNREHLDGVGKALRFHDYGRGTKLRVLFIPDNSPTDGSWIDAEHLELI